jgi:hypothetical protein
MTEKDEKKQRVIHTRVSETMDQELKDRAASLGVSVSNLIRNVLQNTFGLVEDIVADSASVARSARGEPRPEPLAAPAAAAAPEDQTVVGWQVLVLALNAICTRCNTILPRGSQAAMAIAATGAARPREFICPACLKELGHEEPRTDVEP